MASHSSHLGTRFQCSRVLFIMHEGYLVRAAVADAKIEFKQLSDCLICKESITTFHFSETHTERHPQRKFLNGFGHTAQNYYIIASMHAGMLSHFCCVRLFVTLWTVDFQALLSVGFSRQEYQSGLPCPPSGHLSDPGIKLMFLLSPAVAGRFFTAGK